MPFDKVSGKIENMARKACSICFIFTLGNIFALMISIYVLGLIFLQSLRSEDSNYVCKWDVGTSFGCYQIDKGCRCGIKRVEEIEGNKTIEISPWMVKIRASHGDKDFRCGGSIIANKFVVTAAHCVLDAELVWIELGGFFPGDIKGFNPVKRITVHPGYNRTTFDNDIALLETWRPIDLKMYSPICLRKTSDPDAFDNKRIQVIVYRDGIQRILRTRILHSRLRLCSRLLAGWSKESRRSRLFALQASDALTRPGDSGGPVIYNNNDTEPSTLIGSVSYCRDLVRQNGEVYLEAYTRISFFMDWIETTVLEGEVHNLQMCMT